MRVRQRFVRVEACFAGRCFAAMFSVTGVWACAAVSVFVAVFGSRWQLADRGFLVSFHYSVVRRVERGRL